MKTSVLFYILISVCHLAWASRSNVIQILSCPGDVLTIECAIMGGGATVWQGTAFQCDDHNFYRDITLRHSQFGAQQKPTVTSTCNSGTIIAQAIGIVNNSYISELTVTVSPEMNNTTVECVHSYNLTETLVKSTTITVLPSGRQEKYHIFALLGAYCL